MKEKLTGSWEFVKWLFQKIFDPKTSIGKVIIVVFFLMFCISAFIFYVYITDEEHIKIEKDKIEKVNAGN